jgi:hypothetical protein
MPAHKETTLQICIICFLVFMLGARMVVQYPQWFNGEEQAAEQFITLGPPDISSCDRLGRSR